MPFGSLVFWLIDGGERRLDLPDLFVGFCDRLRQHGLPIHRVTLGLETLHPEDSGRLLTWLESGLDVRETARAGVLASDAYRLSPTFVVDETGQPFHWRRHEPTRGMPLLEDLQASGTTQYVMLPLPFLDTSRTAVMSFATRSPGGFTPAELRTLEQATRLFSPWAERVVLRRIAIDLLAAYLGPVAGLRVYDGQIERGDVQTIRAAIACCDLRGFTTLSDRMPRRELVELLNRWFEVVGGAITGQGGEILKFMGDGLLAVFPIGSDPAATCDRALAAVEGALRGAADLGSTLVTEGHEPLRFGLALHLGDVEFGNIGTRHRLDFTVIGPAVNLASRLESLTKELGEPVVASEAFARTATRSLRRLGRYAVRGIAQRVAIYAPALELTPS